jgi:hypothetical protein
MLWLFKKRSFSATFHKKLVFDLFEIFEASGRSIGFKKELKNSAIMGIINVIISLYIGVVIRDEFLA